MRLQIKCTTPTVNLVQQSSIGSDVPHSSSRPIANFLLLSPLSVSCVRAELRGWAPVQLAAWQHSVSRARPPSQVLPVQACRTVLYSADCCDVMLLAVSSEQAGDLQARTRTRCPTRTGTTLCTTCFSKPKLVNCVLAPVYIRILIISRTGISRIYLSGLSRGEPCRLFVFIHHRL